MAYLTLNAPSRFLGSHNTTGIFLPDPPFGTSAKEFYSSEGAPKFKVMWLLHGADGNYADFSHKSKTELYAQENNLALVMVSGMNTYFANWTNMFGGLRVFDYIFEELMPLVYGCFPISPKREDNFVLGISMGGMGAMKCAFEHPEKFAGAAVLSASPFRFDSEFSAVDENLKPRFRNLADLHGGVDALLGSEDDLWSRTGDTVEKDLPKMYFSIGDRDGAFPRWESFRKYAEELGLGAFFEVIPCYGHEWRLWDITIQRAMRCFGFDVRDDV